MITQDDEKKIDHNGFYKIGTQSELNSISIS